MAKSGGKAVRTDFPGPRCYHIFAVANLGESDLPINISKGMLYSGADRQLKLSIFHLPYLEFTALWTLRKRSEEST
jgi:hypothetical protein